MNYDFNQVFRNLVRLTTDFVWVLLCDEFKKQVVSNFVGEVLKFYFKFVVGVVIYRPLFLLIKI